jgi:fatty-acyl-CoA synthase
MELLLDAFASDARSEPTTFCHFIQSGGETKITYADLRKGASRYAHFYSMNGIQRGEVVVIILRHSPELIYAFLGAMLAGGIPSFMPPPTSKQDSRVYWSSHQQLFARINGGVLLTGIAFAPAIRENLPDLPLRLLIAEEAVDQPLQFAASSAKAADIAFLQHSSGTTGLKKGVALSHTAVLTQIASYAAALQLSPSDRIVSWLPLYHDMGLIACFLLPLVTRTPVIMIDPFEWVVNPTLLFDAIKQYRGTLCWQPNFAFHHLARTVRTSARLDLSSMRAWIDCSEPCRAETFELFERKFATAGVRPDQLQVCYAMAETVFAITQTPVGQPPRILAIDAETMGMEQRAQGISVDSAHQVVLSTGRAISGLYIRIVDAERRPLPDGSVGEICVSGDCLFSGYHRLPSETRRKLYEGWYYTGDRGFLRDGELYVTGRNHDLIIVHGRNYYAHELEFIVNQAPHVHPGRTVATGWFRPEVGSEEVIIIAETDRIAETERILLAQAIKDLLLSATGLAVFDVHLVPTGWVIKTTSGKLSRVDNLQKYLAALAGARPEPAPMS